MYWITYATVHYNYKRTRTCKSAHITLSYRCKQLSPIQRNLLKSDISKFDIFCIKQIFLRFHMFSCHTFTVIIQKDAPLVRPGVSRTLLHARARVHAREESRSYIQI